MMPVTIYTTAFCPYCVRAKHLLQKRGVTQFHEVRIDENPEERTAMMERTGRRTVPQIFIGNHHVGGHDDLVALDQQGGLLPLLGGRWTSVWVVEHRCKAEIREGSSLF